MSRGLRRPWPLRARLVGSFLLIMAIVLVVAAGFVFWRVQVALDDTLDGRLSDDTANVKRAWTDRRDPQAALRGLPPETPAELVDPSGRVLAATPAADSLSSPLLPPGQLRRSTHGSLQLSPGHLLSGGGHRLRLSAVPLRSDTGATEAVAVVGVRVGQRDEALRELLGQLASANLTALALAGAVGYRLTRKALDPVEHYRQQAEAIIAGAAEIRLRTTSGDDEVTRLGHTLNRMLDVQDAAARRQRQFLADASHELRTPLAAIKAEVELALRKQRSDDAYRQALTHIGEDTDRLIRLAEQLLDLERAQRSNDGQAPRMTCDIARVAERVTARARAIAPSYRPITTALPETPVSALSEQAAEQILTNLVANALTHGEGEVLVALHRGGSATSPIVITVRDEGSGLEPSFVPTAIDRFRRQDTARTSPGSGLGLALVHQLVVAGGGELRLCTRGCHHAFQPHRFAEPCTHPAAGTHACVLLPDVGSG